MDADHLDRLFSDTLMGMMDELEERVGRRLTREEMHSISSEAFAKRKAIDAEFELYLRKRLMTKSQIRRSVKRRGR